MYTSDCRLDNAVLGDSCRIQTCNLLIRSQMLYSVELTNQLFASLGVSFPIAMQSYNFFPT